MILRVIHSAMALLFGFAAALNANDPDPLPWMVMYGAGALVAGLAALRPGRLPWVVPALVGLVALVWAGAIAPGAWGRVPLERMFASWEMKNTQVEENREMFGLAILAAWMFVTAIAARRRAAAPRA